MLPYIIKLFCRSTLNVVLWDKMAEDFTRDIHKNKYEEPFILIIASGKVGMFRGIPRTHTLLSQCNFRIICTAPTKYSKLWLFIRGTGHLQLLTYSLLHQLQPPQCGATA